MSPKLVSLIVCFCITHSYILTLIRKFTDRIDMSDRFLTCLYLYVTVWIDTNMKIGRDCGNEQLFFNFTHSCKFNRIEFVMSLCYTIYVIKGSSTIKCVHVHAPFKSLFIDRHTTSSQNRQNK